MATHAVQQQTAQQNHLRRLDNEVDRHRNMAPPANETPPPLPKSPPTKPRKVQLPSPPEVIKDNQRKMVFTRCGFLGEGGFARVYEVTDQKHQHHAIKVVAKVNLQSKKSKTKLYAEIKLHRALQHPNIVMFEDCFEDEENVYMTMALCENGNLNDLLRRRKRYTEPETRFFVLQLIGACHYMHTHQVIHRDLKLGNIFLDRDMNVQVGDFGLAALIETPGDRKKTICGTPNYIAPEVLFDTANGHSFEVDTWSIGVIIYTLLVGRPPFQTSDVKSIYDRIKHNNYEFPQNKPISGDAQDLISQILTHDPKERPTLHEIVDHPFFAKGTFPPFIPVTAHEYPPSFAHITRQQSKANFARVRHAVLLDVETDLRVDVAPEVSVSSRHPNAASAQQQKQEREFHKAVQPASPISALLKSAREPLLVSKSPLRQSENRPPPANALLRKLSAAAPPSAGTTSLKEKQTDEPKDEKVYMARKPSRTKSPSRPPLQTLPTLVEEQDEARRLYDLASQKARIVTQMASGAEDGRRTGKERDRGPVPIGKGLSAEETENIKPIREARRTGKSSTSSLNAAPRLHGFESVAQTLDAAFNAKDVGIVFREPALDDNLSAPKVFIQSWVDYCNKYGMGYALTDGSVGVHFNDSTTMVLSADKLHFEFLSSRRQGAAYVRKNYTVKDHPPDLKSKVYLLKHFERYMLDRLFGEHEYTWEDVGRTSDLVFVHKYLRMKHVILFKLSHDVLQFNFFDHTKIIFSSGGLYITYIDKHSAMSSFTLSSIMDQYVHPSRNLSEDKRRVHNKLVTKITYCKDVLHHILTHAPSRIEDKGATLDNYEPSTGTIPIRGGLENERYA
ncbi:hypothetical protein BS47DRAFT_1326163 [Hydnum rufescens UP504]|uniref:Serine/threonine-protein kinase n=1 Tax=Hydnum rufescens UP504 TaxID=1448309 RepID=A0A9P6B4D5_9AGAM|nr:hypothetical protein BS47DRAFT_1326163 [Hydnum rufescens UP504]